MTTPAGASTHAPTASRWGRQPATTTFWTGYDILLAALLVLVASDALSKLGVASPVWLLVYGMMLVRIGLCWRAFYDVVARNAVFLLYPAVCLASVLWSDTPGWSLTAAIQLTMTILFAMFVGWRFSLKGICLLQFGVASTGIVLSIVQWATGIFGAPMYSDVGGFTGIYTQKNMLGQRALAGIIAAIALLMVPIRRLDPRVKVAALAMLPMFGLTLFLSRSFTPILLISAFTGLMLLLCVHRLSPGVILAGLVAGLLGIALGPVALAIADVNPVLATLKAIGKDPTLTGRTEIWDLALRLIPENPLFGVGFGAFWKSSTFMNDVLLAREYGTRTADSFHNFVLEIVVGTGVLGLAAIGALVCVTLWRLGVLFVRTRAVIAAYALTFTIAAVVLSLFGPGLYRQHEFLIVFVVMTGVAARKALTSGTEDLP